MNPREMERYNPFAVDQSSGLDRDATSGTTRQPISASQRTTSQTRDVSSTSEPGGATSGLVQQASTASSGRYSTSFPDPFSADDALESRFAPTASAATTTGRVDNHGARQPSSNRSNSVTFMHRLGERDGDQDKQTSLEPAGQTPRTPSRGSRQASGFTSFLSRATSVTSSSVTDRVSGAVGSMRSAVDSLSSQISQAVPSSTSHLISNAFNQDQPRSQQQQQQEEGASSGLDLASQESKQQQSAASYLAARLSSATNQFVGGGVSGGGLTGGGGSFAFSSTPAAANQAGQLEGGQTATICRQRVVLILDNLAGGTDWPQQFTQYRRLVSGLAPQSSASLAFTSFLAAQFSSSSSSAASNNQLDGFDSDLIEQVHFKDVSVLANQSSATAAVFVSGSSAGLQTTTAAASSSSSLPINLLTFSIVGGSGGGGGGGTSSSQQQQQQGHQMQQQLHCGSPPFAAKTVRPEYVVVRQRGREHLGHLKSIVKALDYCAVPMFEPYEVWNVFQDRQLIFAKLLRVQRQLGKENFPLIPQVFCQTHQDLLNYINNSQVCLPCLVRTGPLGKGKIRINNHQMLKDFATIMATSGQSCTIEQYLDVKCDLIVQKLGTSLKLFKGRARKESFGGSWGGQRENEQQGVDSSLDSVLSSSRQAAGRQTSLAGGAAGLFGLMSQSGMSGSGSQTPRNNSNLMQNSTAGNNFEKLAEVNARYRQWVEAIIREFDNKIDVFCIKIVVAGNDREYIVGLRNCSMEFLGNQENQDEDKRSLVELIISKMNTILPKHQPVSREPSAAIAGQHPTRKSASGNDDAVDLSTTETSKTPPARLAGSDKRATCLTRGETSGQEMSQRQQQQQQHNNNMLNNRNRSVSMNQGEPPMRPLNQTEWGQSGLRHSQLSSGASQQRPQPHQLPRRASDRSDSLLANNEDFSLSETIDAPLSSSSNARQSSLGQSFFDQTSTALSSFQRQSMSFLRRLETRTGGGPEFGGGGGGGMGTGAGTGTLTGTGTPPLSAKSDSASERAFLGGGPMDRPGHGDVHNLARGATSTAPNSAESQSMGVNPNRPHSSSQQPPPKPPPPPLSSLIGRQSSLASYSSSSIHQQRAGGLNQQQRVRSDSSGGFGSGSALWSSSPKTAATITPQNSLNQGSFSDDSARWPSLANGASTSQQQARPSQQQKQQRVVRQNSALSAFEPFDANLRSEGYLQREGDHQQGTTEAAATSGASGATRRPSQDGSRQPASGASKYDSVSMKSGNSNTSDETTTAEDTMNNLKKTFASIFGDKCE